VMLIDYTDALQKMERSRQGQEGAVTVFAVAVVCFVVGINRSVMAWMMLAV